MSKKTITPRDISKRIAQSFKGKKLTIEELESMITKYGNARVSKNMKDVLDWLQSDDIYVTDKDGKKLPDAIIECELPDSLKIEK